MELYPTNLLELQTSKKQGLVELVVQPEKVGGPISYEQLRSNVAALIDQHLIPGRKGKMTVSTAADFIDSDSFTVSIKATQKELPEEVAPEEPVLQTLEGVLEVTTPTANTATVEDENSVPLMPKAEPVTRVEISNEMASKIVQGMVTDSEELARQHSNLTFKAYMGTGNEDDPVDDETVDPAKVRELCQSNLDAMNDVVVTVGFTLSDPKL